MGLVWKCTIKKHMLRNRFGIACTVWWDWLGIVGKGQEWLRIVVYDPVIDENLLVGNGCAKVGNRWYG